MKRKEAMLLAVGASLFFLYCSASDGQNKVFLRKDRFLKTDYYELMLVPTAKDDINNVVLKFNQDVAQNGERKRQLKFIVTVNPSAPDLRNENYLIVDDQPYAIRLGKIQRRNFTEVSVSERLHLLGQNRFMRGMGGTQVTTTTYDNCVGSTTIPESFLQALGKAKKISLRVYLGNIAHEYDFEYYDYASLRQFIRLEADDGEEQ